MTVASTTTVVFADLTGSTGVFEALGNEKASRAVTQLTQWISLVCEHHGGRVVKTLGDGVLALFPRPHGAVDAAVQLQRAHRDRVSEWPPQLRMRLQIGMACGEIVEVEGDCYGDAVNVASRLSDLSGAEQIWATDTVVDLIDQPAAGVRFRSLGAIDIRGKAQSRVVFRIEWQEELHSQLFTAPAALVTADEAASETGSSLTLRWLDQTASFEARQMPIHLGRVADAEFMVNDQRVSRLHASIEWRRGSFILTDLSSFGTWVRFSGTTTELALRRQECVLVGSGEIALGAAFQDFTVPVVQFELA